MQIILTCNDHFCLSHNLDIVLVYSRNRVDSLNSTLRKVSFLYTCINKNAMRKDALY